MASAAKREPGSDGWLGIGPASRRLGVHPDTLRRWADERRVEAWVTPGGHRRFSRSSIVALTARIRREPAVREVADDLDERARAAFRARGVRLVKLLRAYAASDDQDERARLLAGAEECGVGYGRDASEHGVSLAAAMRVALAIRRHIVGEVPEAASVFDRVLVVMTAAYAAAEAQRRGTIRITAR